MEFFPTHITLKDGTVIQTPPHVLAREWAVQSACDGIDDPQERDQVEAELRQMIDEARDREQQDKENNDG